MKYENLNLTTGMKNEEQELQKQISELKAIFDNLKNEAELLSQLHFDNIRLQENLKACNTELYQQFIEQKKTSNNLTSAADGKNAETVHSNEIVEQLRENFKTLERKLSGLNQDHHSLAAIARHLDDLKYNFEREISNLRKELGLAKTKASRQGSTKPKRKNSGALVYKLAAVEKKLFGRFPRLSFFLKRNALLIAWTLKGSAKNNYPKLRFWQKHQYIPYRLLDTYLLIQNSSLFERDWYLSAYKDVKKNNEDPILHFMLHGWREMRDPGPHFNTYKYLAIYRDIKAADVNPLLHYLENGRKEGRVIFDSPLFNPEHILGAIIESADETIADDVANEAKIGVSDKAEDNVTGQPQHVHPLLNYGNKLRASKRSITTIKKVAFITQPEYFDFHYKDELDHLYEVKYFLNSFSDDPSFFKNVIDFDADINVFFRGEIVPKEVLQSLTGVTVNLSSEPFPKIINRSFEYTEDSLNRFKFFLKILDKPYDYVFHYDEVSKSFFENQGIQLSGFFPFPIITDKIKPQVSEKKWDMFFSGRTTTHRDKYFGPLKRDFNFLHINHGVAGSDLLEFISKCKISLNIHAEDEVSWEPRTQLLLAAGSLMISEPLSPTCPLRPGIDYIEVKNEWELYETCKNVLENYEKYQHIAKNGRARVEQILSSKINFPEFFNDLINNKYSPAAYNRNLIKLKPLELNIKYNGFKHLLTELIHEHA
jgi:hypothetical protein